MKLRIASGASVFLSSAIARNVSSASADDAGRLASLPLILRDDCRSQVRHRLRQRTGMLPNIEPVQMKPERSHLPQQRIDQQLHQPLSAIRTQAFAHHQQVALELRRRRVCVGMRRGIAAEAQARGDKIQEVPVDLDLGDALPARVFFAQRGLVNPHSLGQRFRDSNTPQRHAQLARPAASLPQRSGR